MNAARTTEPEALNTTGKEPTMTTIDPTATLGALVNAHPQLAREFELRGLDYCCGGAQSLADACAARGLDTQPPRASLLL